MTGIFMRERGREGGRLRQRGNHISRGSMSLVYVRMYAPEGRREEGGGRAGESERERARERERLKLSVVS